ncbi:alpha/beta hydrolase [Glaciihabitans sp. INWT7]|uniref:alpha/beta hydrolase n=1 Tax=Glaciihabitans sp. INWT7 TaxID=2596912 RepID=UPI001628A2D4|nr:alpha/beta hydrolase [Glaciihabitans sp. INWT7]QNE48002.1 alpha/beta hydrolase [Glaciihabitans sp. INWT7]
MTRDDASLDRPHVFLPGAGPESAVLLALHGTGGSEESMADFARQLDDDAAVLAPRGLVVEGPHARWFRRMGEGVFDVDDVEVQADRLADFVLRAQETYSLGERRFIAVGFSNGANMALALATRHPELLTGVVAFSGMYPYADRELSTGLSGLTALLLNGQDDAMAPQPSVARLEGQLRERGATVDRRTRAGGHGVTEEELQTAREWLGPATSR